jgi:hypothetical protein
MRHDASTELTDQERAAFAALDRAGQPSRMLEERTVGLLRERGLLGRRRRAWFGMRPGLVAAAAAAVALFASGVVVGQWFATRTVVASVAAANHESAMQMAATVQRAGSAYVAALAALAQVADSANGPSVDQGREAALAALYAAVGELMVLAPDDPVTSALRDLFDRTTPMQGTAGQPEIRNVVWF